MMQCPPFKKKEKKKKRTSNLIFSAKSAKQKRIVGMIHYPLIRILEHKQTAGLIQFPSF